MQINTKYSPSVDHLGIDRGGIVIDVNTARGYGFINLSWRGLKAWSFKRNRNGSMWGQCPVGSFYVVRAR